MRGVLVVALMVSLALAGCTSNENADPTVVPIVCSGQEVPVLDANQTTTGCAIPPPAASIDFAALPTQVQIYEIVNLTWTLHTHKAEAHAMKTEIVVSDVSVPDAELAAPEKYGETVIKREHQNFVDGQVYDFQHQFLVPGTYYFRSYAYVSSEHIWSAEQVLTITEVQATGKVTDVEIVPLGPLGGLSEETVALALGDAITWTHGGLLLPITITKLTGPADFTLELGAGETSTVIVFVVPGAYSYEATDGVSSYTGTLNVNAPKVL